MAWTIDKLTEWTPAHLEEATVWAAPLAPMMVDHFETYRDRLGAMDTWEGQAKEGAWEAASWGASAAVGAAYPIVNGSAQMTEIASAATAMKGLVLDQIGLATADGLVVSPDLKQVSGPPGTQELAEAHAGMIKHYLGQFQDVLDTGARSIRSQSAELAGVGLPDSGVRLTDGHTEPHVQMVDNKFKLGPDDIEPSVPEINSPDDEDMLIGAGIPDGGASTQSGLGSEDTRLPAMPREWPPAEAVPANCLTPDQVKDKLFTDAGKGVVLGALPGAVLGGPLGAVTGGATAAVANDTGDLLDMADGTTKLCEK